MIKHSSNPKAEQSKQWIRDALLRLMDESLFQDITITEITDHAGVSRRTFYRNFETKKDVIFFHFEGIFHQYIAKLKTLDRLSMPHITHAFFSFWANYRDFLLLLERNQLFYLILEGMNRYMPAVYKLFKGHKNEYDHEELSYVLHYSVGGYWNTLRLWLNEQCSKDPSDLAAIFQKAMAVNMDEIPWE